MDLGSNSGTVDQNKNIIQEMSMFLQHCRELDERQQSWLVRKKETCWRLKRLEQQLEAEKIHKQPSAEQKINSEKKKTQNLKNVKL